MTRTIARWMNEDKTWGAMLASDGTLYIIQRENSGQVWSPPIKVNLDRATVDVSAVLTDIPEDRMKEWSFIDS